jgi:hypothetical protein
MARRVSKVIVRPSAVAFNVCMLMSSGSLAGEAGESTGRTLFLFFDKQEQDSLEQACRANTSIALAPPQLSRSSGISTGEVSRTQSRRRPFLKLFGV